MSDQDRAMNDDGTLNEEWVRDVAQWMRWGDPDDEMPYCSPHRTWHHCEFTREVDHE